MRIVLGVTGASGAIYGVRLAQELEKAGSELSIAVSDAAKKVLAAETPNGFEELERAGRLLGEDELDANISSGSAKWTRL